MFNVKIKKEGVWVIASTHTLEADAIKQLDRFKAINNLPDAQIKLEADNPA
jgi:hypothetical protein